MTAPTKEQNEKYLAACAKASAMLKAGQIKAYGTGYDRVRGRVIQVQTEHGWNEVMFYQDNWPKQRDRATA